MGCCEDYLTCDIAFNAVMSLSRASTRGRYSRIEGVTRLEFYLETLFPFNQLKQVFASVKLDLDPE